MDPNNQQIPKTPSAQQTPPTGQFDSSQFDFIMNPQQAPKKGLLPPMSPKKRKIMFLAFGLIGVLLIFIIGSLLFSGGSGATDKVLKVAQEQTEIIRIAELGKQKASGSDVKTLAALTSSVVTTDQTKTVDYLAQQKKKVKDKELSLGKDSKVDSDLSAASANGRFDEVFKQILLEKLNKYADNLKNTFPALGTKGKELFDQNYNNVVIILKDNQSAAN